MKKVLAVLLAVMMVFAIAACTKKDTVTDDKTPENDVQTPADDTSDENTNDEQTPADDTTDNDTLVMATNAYFKPYEYYEGDKIVGIDPTVAGLIADKLGMKLVINDMEFDAIIPALTSGKADIAMAGMTVTEERLQSINFSDSYATGVQVIIVKEDSDISSADDIVAKIENGENIQIGCQIVTTGYIYASDTIENGGFGEDHVQAFPKGADAIAALTSGKIDCVIIDNEPAKAFVEANNG
mgnify:CR=1 FL=1